MRIAGVIIPSKKKVKIALRYIYGIGPYIANLICQDSGIDPEKRVNDLNPDEISKIMSAIKKHPTEGDLRSKIMLNIRRLVSIGCYRGQRHKKGLPVRGQRTHTNAKTSKKLLKAFRV